MQGVETSSGVNDNKISFDGKDHHLMDISADVSLGVELIEQFQFTLNYQYGLTNIEVDAIQQRNRVLQLSVSYFFSKLSFK
ncbi:hypothetical protein [Plebeiibacterium sediminum]|uniref:Outer membrane protein beta-barrel domain-containing protein n=1 Tax=Plebeiibacterium sediminum TaxID=2992112 RepID=A0AAE3M1U3_9BACT|nr:hypothetical protein [Plebeiobacterium sediminum]MCW3785185.1 hypothetical protein [Plebeiobacterium sediminum]